MNGNLTPDAEKTAAELAAADLLGPEIQPGQWVRLLGRPGHPLKQWRLLSRIDHRAAPEPLDGLYWDVYLRFADGYTAPWQSETLSTNPSSAVWWETSDSNPRAAA